ncbi:MAG: riboflavin synthase subunit alpha [Rhodospirillales bacterium]|jgi:riboflavin synthase|nr:riboflavin synthase subunit alpha [Rhodospirillales bacterium]
MFTGIITDLGTVRSVVPGGDTKLVVATRYAMAEVAIGASIACSGACLTVVEKDDGWFAAMVSAETMARTNLGSWREGTRINLERPLRLGDELGGHMVLGHVDGIARIVGRDPEGDSLRFSFEAPADLSRLIAPKGSVALDGVSLTVNEVEGRRFGVNIIPHTQSCTSFGTAAVGDTVNLEIDPLARYVARLLQTAGA